MTIELQSRDPSRNAPLPETPSLSRDQERAENEGMMSAAVEEPRVSSGDAEPMTVRTPTQNPPVPR
jgi:hypothetical protein